MRYAPPGLCLNDFDLLRVGDEWRLLHLQAPPVHPFDAALLETSYGQASSRDLVSWTPLAPAFGIGPPGSFDDSAVWTMHRVPTEGGTAMFYTGVTRDPDGGARQAVGLALAGRDGEGGWRRANGGRPVVTADPAWYRTDTAMAWRDPFVVRDTARGRWLMLVCARTRDEPLGRSGCVGTATSTDLHHWETGPPLLAPGDIDELECPVLEPVEDGWLLLGSIGPDHEIRSWHAPDLTGPWSPQGRLGPAGAYAPRLTTAGGDRLLVHTLERRHGLRDDGPLGRGVIAQPKVLRHTPGSPPELCWWSGLDAHLGAPSPAAAQHEPAPSPDGCLEATLTGPTPRLQLRVRDGGDAAVEIALADGVLTAAYPGGPELARTAVPRAPRRSLRVLTVAEYLEVYLDDVFVLACCAYRPSGSGARLTVDGRPHPLVRRPLGEPAARDDVSAVHRPLATAPIR
ncbi:mucin-1 [Streptomyces sp. JJ36]|uniref:mucin-1 n=1 Tax=Streptomyces sp. JJ36 TaxID=2736645 RepID=UPI001F42E223|nr:mucin-1 [Streptomyces sp. JJ36]MCF6525757.1 mucin-1 [Streptomyces sp. JJ36]